MNRAKILIITMALLIVVPINGLDFHLSLNTKPLPTSDFNSISTVNPFDVHNSSGPNGKWDIYLMAGTYFLNLATSSPFESYYNVSFAGNGLTEQFYTNNYEFHGVNINKSGIYRLNSVGSGKWMFSLFAQDPDKIYSFQLSSSESFVIVPNIGGNSEIKISFRNNQSVDVTFFDELLKSIYSVKLTQDGTLYLNLSGDYEGILFLSVSPASDNTFFSFSWTPIQKNKPPHASNIPTLNSYYPEIMVVIATGLVIVLLHKKKKTDMRKRRRRRLRRKF